MKKSLLLLTRCINHVAADHPLKADRHKFLFIAYAPPLSTSLTYPEAGDNFAPVWVFISQCCYWVTWEWLA